MTTLVDELSDYRESLDSATTRESIGAIYLDMVGYDIADEGDDTVDELRDIALDYILECCYAYGIHVSQVGLG